MQGTGPESVPSLRQADAQAGRHGKGGTCKYLRKQVGPGHTSAPTARGLGPECRACSEPAAKLLLTVKLGHGTGPEVLDSLTDVRHTQSHCQCA